MINSLILREARASVALSDNTISHNIYEIQRQAAIDTPSAQTWAVVPLSDNGSDPFIVLDVSRWQGEMDFNKAYSAGARAVCIRATVGDYYTDPRFIENWHKAKDAGLLVSAYHVIAPALDAVFISAEAQMDHFLNVLGTRISDFPFVLDCELSGGQQVENITNVIKKSCDILEGYLGKPIIYTRKYWWDSYVSRRDYWSDYDLWVAHYTDAETPLLPMDWDTWELWQYSADGNGRGAEFGAESRAIDISRVRAPDYFDFSEPEEPPMSDELDRVIADARRLEAEGVNYVINLDMMYLQIDEPDPVDPPKPQDPPDPLSVQVQITDDKALAHYIVGENAKDKPIMVIYPSEVSPAAERVRYDQGDRVDVDPDKFKADEVDGSEGFWLIDELAFTGQGHVVKVDLFLQESKVTKV